MSNQWKLNSPQSFKSAWLLVFFSRFLPKRILILNTDISVFQHTNTDTYSIFFRLNTATDTSVVGNHTGYWILVFSFCTGQVSASNKPKDFETPQAWQLVLFYVADENTKLNISIVSKWKKSYSLSQYLNQCPLNSNYSFQFIDLCP